MLIVSIRSSVDSEEEVVEEVVSEEDSGEKCTDIVAGPS